MNNTSSRTFADATMPIKTQAHEELLNYAASGHRPVIGVLVNPFSGGNRNNLEPVRSAIAENPQAFHCDVQTPQDVLTALVEFARNDVNLVAIVAGDGTVQAALTAIFDAQPLDKMPVLTVLQAGTTSMTARDVGICGSPNKSLRKLFQWAATSESPPRIIQRPVLAVQAPGHPTRYGMFFGTAAIYQGIQYFHRKVNTKGLRGELGPGLTILRFLWAAMRQDSEFIPVIPLSITLDNHPPRQLDTFVLLVSTLERLFLGLYPYWGDESGPLHFTALRARPRYFLRSLPSILRGRRGRYGSPENGFYSHNVREIQLTLDSGFTLDGQLYTPETRQQPTVVRYGGTASFLQI